MDVQIPLNIRPQRKMENRDVQNGHDEEGREKGNYGKKNKIFFVREFSGEPGDKHGRESDEKQKNAPLESISPNFKRKKFLEQAEKGT